VIEDWWLQIKDMYLEDCAEKCIELQSHDKALIAEVPIGQVLDFLIKKRLVQDRQSASKLISQQIGGPNKLQNIGMMCYEEFNRLFCKGMFKVALINTLDGLQNQIGEANADSEQDIQAFKKMNKEQ
jgi:hypothetical protein